MGKFIIGSLLGLIVGGLLTFYFFVGVPSAGQIPGTPVQAPDANGTPPATAQLILKQEFFNEVLKTIFRELNAPSFPLSSVSAAQNTVKPQYALFQTQNCEGRITLLPEGSGIQSSLKFENNRLVAPIAFTGSYNSAFGCLNFSGWAQANLELRFDAEKQTVFGQLNIETVNLDSVPPFLSGVVTPLVQGTLNQRVNPIQILQGSQIALNLPINAANGNLNAVVKDVRSEIKDNALHLYIIYQLNGTTPNQKAL